MHLKALRMRGFKSFPGTVELHFEPGIAVVVGPNGSGKSNIADALQWAMAVQSPSQLRAPTGLDVLFGGSDSRPPAGVCEVELVLDNQCATLPLEFGEVSVMRRLDRGGESEYMINRARVRRLDVLELLADTGLGREMHSVIGQGRVDEILTSKPHERRRFVEEAAGLGKYQRRRTRAEAKLARVSSELERARDLEREVRARLRPLQMQATAAERAARLGDEIAAGRLRLLASDRLGEQLRADSARARLDEARAAQAEVDARLVVVGERRSRAEGELTGLAAEQERASRGYYDFETARERLAAARRRLEQAATALGRTQLRAAVQTDRLGADAERFAAEAAQASEQAAEACPRPTASPRSTPARRAKPRPQPRRPSRRRSTPAEPWQRRRDMRAPPASRPTAAPLGPRSCARASQPWRTRPRRLRAAWWRAPRRPSACTPQRSLCGPSSTPPSQPQSRRAPKPTARLTPTERHGPRPTSSAIAIR